MSNEARREWCAAHSNNWRQDWLRHWHVGKDPENRSSEETVYCSECGNSWHKVCALHFEEEASMIAELSCGVCKRIPDTSKKRWIARNVAVCGTKCVHYISKRKQACSLSSTVVSVKGFRIPGRITPIKAAHVFEKARSTCAGKQKKDVYKDKWTIKTPPSRRHLEEFAKTLKAENEKSAEEIPIRREAKSASSSFLYTESPTKDMKRMEEQEVAKGYKDNRMLELKEKRCASFSWK
ncbi:hypothetical protein CRE_20832 [Caenorhabditis remanei]|uniref:Uncharacterized protein n=1 Tax=Caenorhabditis remanei TaxID=31234 RepID=E3MV14_CAERE|nr:hypothetical protein CRE_20832 [Caenorhabditis remanei]